VNYLLWKIFDKLAGDTVAFWNLIMTVYDVIASIIVAFHERDDSEDHPFCMCRLREREAERDDGSLVLLGEVSAKQLHKSVWVLYQERH
jgi:hypothetical protein